MIPLRSNKAPFFLGLGLAAIIGCETNKTPNAQGGSRSNIPVFSLKDTNKSRVASGPETNSLPGSNPDINEEYVKKFPSTPGGPVSDCTVFNLTGTEMEHLLSESKTNGWASNRISQYYNFSRSDSGTALIWMRKAAEQGVALAQYNLGATLTEFPNLGSAGENKYWLRKAASQGDETAKKVLLYIDSGRLK